VANAESTIPGTAEATRRLRALERKPGIEELQSGEPVVDRLIGDQPTRWWALGGSWLAVAFSVGFGLFVNNEAQGREVSFSSSLMATFPHYLVWALASPAIYRSMHKAIEGKNRILWLSRLLGWSLIALAGSTAMSYLSYFMRRDLTPSFGQLIDIYFLPPAGPAFNAMNFSILVLALAGFAVVRGLRLRDHALWEGAQAELHGARLEAQLAAARLLALQSQINPHFLLNSLNAIGALVQVGERDRAFDAIGKLGELRFDANFRSCVSVPESVRGLRVPALIVQPLIENSIRHGMVPLRVLTVDMRAYEQDAAVVIEVEDDGCGISSALASSLPTGHGFANVAERLRPL
jgi:hypothetical protein